VNLRHLRYFVVLAQEGHFGRAARASHITQPTLSAAIRLLETEFGAPLVHRSRQSFEALTPEGNQVLAWAQRTLADYSALEDTLAERKGELHGQLRIGVIPTAEPLIAMVSGAIHERYPAVTVTALSHTFSEIERGLAEHSLEAGISYIESASSADLKYMPLYGERYVVCGAIKWLRPFRDGISWKQAATLPLCLLSRDMQNRILIDGHFAAAGLIPTEVAETNTLLGVLSHVRSGRWCAVLPRAMLTLVGSGGGLRWLDLHTPDAIHQVGLLFPARTPLPPLTRALVELARGLRFDQV
jgi:DNA-binding transcriptional LysR family regulator